MTPPDATPLILDAAPVHYDGHSEFWSRGGKAEASPEKTFQTLLGNSQSKGKPQSEPHLSSGPKAANALSYGHSDADEGTHASTAQQQGTSAGGEPRASGQAAQDASETSFKLERAIQAASFSENLYPMERIAYEIQQRLAADAQLFQAQEADQQDGLETEAQLSHSEEGSPKIASLNNPQAGALQDKKEFLFSQSTDIPSDAFKVFDQNFQRLSKAYLTQSDADDATEENLGALGSDALRQPISVSKNAGATASNTSMDAQEAAGSQAQEQGSLFFQKNPVLSGIEANTAPKAPIAAKSVGNANDPQAQPLGSTAQADPTDAAVASDLSQRPQSLSLRNAGQQKEPHPETASSVPLSESTEPPSAQEKAARIHEETQGVPTEEAPFMAKAKAKELRSERLDAGETRASAEVFSEKSLHAELSNPDLRSDQEEAALSLSKVEQAVSPTSAGVAGSGNPDASLVDAKGAKGAKPALTDEGAGQESEPNTDATAGSKLAAEELAARIASNAMLQDAAQGIQDKASTDAVPQNKAPKTFPSSNLAHSSTQAMHSPMHSGLENPSAASNAPNAQSAAAALFSQEEAIPEQGEVTAARLGGDSLISAAQADSSSHLVHAEQAQEDAARDQSRGLTLLEDAQSDDAAPPTLLSGPSSGLQGAADRASVDTGPSLANASPLSRNPEQATMEASDALSAADPARKAPDASEDAALSQNAAAAAARRTAQRLQNRARETRSEGEMDAIKSSISFSKEETGTPSAHESRARVSSPTVLSNKTSSNAESDHHPGHSQDFAGANAAALNAEAQEHASASGGTAAHPGAAAFSESIQRTSGAQTESAGATDAPAETLRLANQEAIDQILQRIDTLRESAHSWASFSLPTQSGTAIQMQMRILNNQLQMRFDSVDRSFKEKLLKGWSQLSAKAQSRNITLADPEFIGPQSESDAQERTAAFHHHLHTQA